MYFISGNVMDDPEHFKNNEENGKIIESEPEVCQQGEFYNFYLYY